MRRIKTSGYEVNQIDVTYFRRVEAYLDDKASLGTIGFSDLLVQCRNIKKLLDRVHFLRAQETSARTPPSLQDSVHLQEACDAAGNAVERFLEDFKRTPS